MELANLARGTDHELLRYLLQMAAIEAHERGVAAAVPASLSLRPTLGIWDWDVSNDRNYTDSFCAEMFGVSPKRAAEGLSNDIYMRAIHPDDVAMLNRELQKAIHEGGEFTAEYRLISNDRLTWVYARGKCTLNKAGTPARFPGAVLDITSMKQSALLRQ